MDYYKKQLFLAQVDPQDKIIKKIERWEAHKKSICHRGFTAVLIYKNQIILQHRKHPAFDGFYDLSFSSHPVFVNNKLQSMEEAITNTLKREWNLTRNDLKDDFVYLDKFYYKASDPKSGLVEHEVDYIYVVYINKLPRINTDFAYGYELVSISNFEFSFQDKKILNLNLAPWVDPMIKQLNIKQLKLK